LQNNARCDIYIIFNNQYAISIQYLNIKLNIEYWILNFFKYANKSDNISNNCSGIFSHNSRVYAWLDG